MTYVNFICNTLGDLLISPLSGENPWPAMLAISFVTSIVFVWAFKVFSNQHALKRKKGRMLARALELLIFRHDMIVSVTAFGRLAVANLSYLGELLKPIGVSLIPALLVLIQLSCWYEYRPFAVGESILVQVDFSDDFPLMSADIQFVPSDGLQVETESMRVPALNQANWRLRAEADGSQWIEVKTDQESVRKQIVVGDRLLKISDRRVSTGFWDELFHPAEPPIENGGPIKQISVQYPHRQLFVAGYEMPWVIAFLILTMIFGLLIGRVMKVSF
tara:strand:+ start:705 stop:1529 length:825 start_codon:yes stop_codon:yes gene_type:complete